MSGNKWTAEQIPSQAGKTALVTGANSGIGYMAARELARKGARVLLGVRDRAKGEAALARLRGEVAEAKADVAALDMASLDSVRQFAEGFRGPLDVLVNNAGVMALPRRELTVDGFERQFGTNHLGHFALTGLLLPHLLQAAAPRVVTVSSLAHRNGKMEWDNLQSERTYKPMGTYANSKLANLLFALELDRRARKAGLQRMRSIAVHPGVARTSIFANGPGNSGLKAMVFGMVSPVLFQSDEMGALPTLYAATAPEASGGEYIGPDGMMAFKGWPKVEEPRPQARDAAAAAKLWEVSEQMTGVRYLE